MCLRVFRVLSETNLRAVFTWLRNRGAHICLIGFDTHERSLLFADFVAGCCVYVIFFFMIT